MKEPRQTIICPHCGKPIELPAAGDKQGGHSATARLLACIIVSVIVCAVGFGIYMHADSRREAEAWELAMQSDDAMTVKAYLDTYRQAPMEHHSAAGELLTRLEAEANDWRRVASSGIAGELMAFAKKHPDSRFAAMAEARADSITYGEALSAGTAERLAAYIEAFPKGRFADEARQKQADLLSASVQPEDEIAAEMVVSGLLRAISEQDGEALIDLMADTLRLFMGKSDVPRNDTPRLISATAAPDGSAANWLEPTDMRLSRAKADAGKPSSRNNIDVTFTLTRTVVDGSATQSTPYRFAITLNRQGRINRLSFSSKPKK